MSTQPLGLNLEPPVLAPGVTPPRAAPPGGTAPASGRASGADSIDALRQVTDALASVARGASPAPGPTQQSYGTPSPSTLSAFTRAVVGQGVWCAEGTDGTVAHGAMPDAERTSAAKTIPALVLAMRRQGITDPNQVAYVLATSELESHDGLQMHEGGNGDANGVHGNDSWFDRYEPNTTAGDAVGNTQPGDGSRFKGRGLVQVTGRANYASLAPALGLAKNDLLAHPERLASDLRLAADAMTHGLTKPGGFTGAGNLDRLIPAGRTPGSADFYDARAAVNGVVAGPATVVANEARALAPIVAKYERSLFGVVK